MRGSASLLRTLMAIGAVAAIGCGDSATTTADADTAVAEDTATVDDTATIDDTAAGDTAVDPDTATAPDGSADTAGGEDIGGSDVTCTVDCPEGETRCGGTTGVATCVADANGCTVWSAPVACDGAKVCQDGACVAACSASDDRCLGDLAVQHCVTGQLVEEGCPFGCDSVAVACRPCAPGAWRCNTAAGDATVEVCAASGVWQSAGPCISCACVAGPPVAMRCLGKDDTATSCAACGDDGQICVP